jgi:glycosyltransferase involved in cell wall biosynthesis
VQDFKISLITVACNAGKTIDQCIRSVIAQNYPNIEYIVIDGGSTDNTLQVIEQYKQHIHIFISEPDNGIYDAMNKGIKLAKGNIVGMLNADDFFADTNILNSVAVTFTRQDTDAIYGDIDYIKSDGAIARKWQSGAYKNGMFNWGWMPPHPTFYCKRSLFEKLGLYDLQYGTAADYELMLRFIHFNKVNVYYLNRTMVKMRIGGVSNKTFINRLNAWRFDIKAMQKNGVTLPLLCILFKPLRKITQYCRKEC